MSSYCAHIYVETGDGWAERTILTPCRHRISEVKEDVASAVRRENINVREIAVMKNTRGKNKIHAYYAWDGLKMVIDPNKDAWIHNVFYGLEN